MTSRLVHQLVTRPVTRPVTQPVPQSVTQLVTQRHLAADALPMGDRQTVDYDSGRKFLI